MFSFLKKKKIICTHNGSFHADDIFACAVLGLYFDQQKQPYKIIRSRDESVIESADCVVDVGGENDPAKDCFDHHQQGGAGARSNGIPYAAFGLVWDKYGKLLSPTEEIAAEVDRRLVQPIDAIDNGISISEPTDVGLCDYGIYGIIGAYQNTWKEAGDTKMQLDNFIHLVNVMKGVISREIERTEHRSEMIEKIQQIYDLAENKEIIEIPYHVSIGALIQVLDKYKEVLYIVSRSNTNWKVLAMRKSPCSFENRKSLPQLWSGKRGEELASITGVQDALFCHNACFMAVARSREGAHLLAKKALEA